ncbi:unnamed protein product [Urochloa decumbens]|uniref:Pectinesterase inhibitor domain-containing protein n=1 Tax=Urochloa decumbens TaxID=240449 RepID=A0ABC9DT76_9POAL
MPASAVSSIAMTSSSLAAVLLCATAAAAFFSVADARTTIGGDLVTKTCADMMSHDWGWLNISEGDKFCVSRLRMDKKRSAAAKHPRDLALIAMDLAQRAVADADAKVAAVLHSGAAGHSSNNTAEHCRLDYASVVSTIPVCRAMVNDYNKKQHLLPNNDYFECARRLRRDTWNCAFRVAVEDDLSKLVGEEAQEAWLRIELVDGMLEEMLGVVVNDHDPLIWS